MDEELRAEVGAAGELRMQPLRQLTPGGVDPGLAVHIQATAGPPGIALNPRDGRAGWQYAHWLVAHAEEHGVKRVRFGDREWTSKGGDWTKMVSRTEAGGIIARWKQGRYVGRCDELGEDQESHLLTDDGQARAAACRPLVGSAYYTCMHPEQQGGVASTVIGGGSTPPCSL